MSTLVAAGAIDGGAWRRFCDDTGHDDPLVPPQLVQRTLDQVGVPPSRHYALNYGGHFPQLVDEHHGDIATAIEYAVNNGADIINLSLGSPTRSDVIARAVADAVAAGVVVVAAAGNSAVQTPHFPASLPGVISVAATNGNGAPADFTNWGTSVDISAPGVRTLTTHRRDAQGVPRLSTPSGTSMATPLVAGVVGLMKSRSPWMGADAITAALTAEGPVGTGVLANIRGVDAEAAVLGVDETFEYTIDYEVAPSDRSHNHRPLAVSVGADEIRISQRDPSTHVATHYLIDEHIPRDRPVHLTINLIGERDDVTISGDSAQPDVLIGAEGRRYGDRLCRFGGMNAVHLVGMNQIGTDRLTTLQAAAYAIELQAYGHCPGCPPPSEG